MARARSPGAGASSLGLLSDRSLSSRLGYGARHWLQRQFSPSGRTTPLRGPRHRPAKQVADPGVFSDKIRLHDLPRLRNPHSRPRSSLPSMFCSSPLYFAGRLPPQAASFNARYRDLEGGRWSFSAEMPTTFSPCIVRRWPPGPGKSSRIPVKSIDRGVSR